jgi:hypothetical protein
MTPRKNTNETLCQNANIWFKIILGKYIVTELWKVKNDFENELQLQNIQIYFFFRCSLCAQN